VVLSDDGEVRKFLNWEQDPEKARNADRWATFGVQGRTLPAPEPQTIFAANSYSTLCRANEKGLIQDFDKEIERAKEVLEPSDRGERLLNQYQSSNREQQEKVQEQQKQQQELQKQKQQQEEQARQRRSRDQEQSH
jgi:Skp family chaperone for outer membrane proteins